MIILDKAVFIHIPKTGGTWVRQALRRGCKTFKEVKGHPIAKDIPKEHKGKFVFAFVRHPISWYRSFYSYRQDKGLRPGDTKLDKYLPNNFYNFMNEVLRKEPSYLTKFFKVRTTGCDFVGRQENLADDLVKALKLAGEDFNEARIRETPPANVSSSKEFRLSPAQVENVLRKEKEIIEEWYP